MDFNTIQIYTIKKHLANYKSKRAKRMKYLQKHNLNNGKQKEKVIVSEIYITYLTSKHILHHHC